MDWVALARRAMTLLFRPTAAWDAAAAETTSAREVLLGYVAPLAAIPAVCGVAGTLVFGFGIADVGLRPSPITVLLEAFAGFALTLAGVWVAGRMVAQMAGQFGGERNPSLGIRVAAYSGTAVWLAGVFYLYPNLQIPAVLLGSLWSLAVLYKGLASLLKVPESNMLACFAVTLLALLGLVILRGFLVAKAAELGGPLSVLSTA